MSEILFVCLGNICRSPLAEAIFNHKVEKKGFADRFKADSAGTSNYHIGEPPDKRTISNALKNGVTIQHRGRQVKVMDFEHYDYVFAMDNSNLESITRLSNGSARAKIDLIRTYDPVSKGGEVPDPYYGGEKGFQEVFEMLDRTIEHLITELTKEE